MRAASAAPGDGGSIARPPSPSSLSKRLQLADHLCTRGSTWLHRICLENSADQRTYFDLCDSRGGPLPDEFHEGHDESTNPDPFPLGQFGRYSAVQGFTGSLPRRRLWPDFLHGERGMLNDRYYFVIGQCSDNHYCFTSPKDEDGHHHIQCVPRGRQPGYRDPTAKYYVYGEHVFLAPAQSDAGSGIAGSASSFDVEVTSAAQDAYMTAYMLDTKEEIPSEEPLVARLGVDRKPFCSSGSWWHMCVPTETRDLRTGDVIHFSWVLPHLAAHTRVALVYAISNAIGKSP